MKPAAEFPRRWTGDINRRHFAAKVKPSNKSKQECEKCGGTVRRSWVTGILHSRCRTCRYLVMMYGESITVRLVEE